jgi:Tol biopolymer transport system component
MRYFHCHTRLVLASLIGLMQICTTEAVEKQITDSRHGHILTNTAVWSPDSQWIVYDVRSDPAGDLFDSNRIERVHVTTGKVDVLYASNDGAHCGVATFCPVSNRVVFILGPAHPDEQWQYAAHHRRGVIVDANHPGRILNLDARDLISPFTPGALRGGTHVHTFSGDGQWVAFTYEDHLLASPSDSGKHDKNQRNIGVSVSEHPVTVPHSHSRNHQGTYFSVLVTRTENHPKPGSDEISRAFSDAWIGSDGYVRGDGKRQEKAIAFQGHVLTEDGDTISEVFVVDLPHDVTQPNRHGPLEGTEDQRPQPPMGTLQRRLTYTATRAYPGIQGVRHWLRSSPDGSQVAFLMRDGKGVSQLWTISPTGGEPRQVTTNPFDIASAFSWTPDGTHVVYAMNDSICITEMQSGETERLTKRNPTSPLRREACVVSPDGRQIAYLRQVTDGGETWNQIFTVTLPAAASAGTEARQRDDRQ